MGKDNNIIFRKKIISRSLLILLISWIFLLTLNTIGSSDTVELSKFETAKGHFRKGFYFFNQMQYLSAVEFFRKALSVYPKYYTAREYLARAYKLAGFIDESSKEWENLANMTSNNLSIINKLDSLRFKVSAVNTEAVIFNSTELIFTGKYSPINLGRFRFTNPIDIAIDNKKNLYVTSFSTGKLVKLDPNGEGISIFETGVGDRFYGVDCFEDKVYLTDFKSDRVYILDNNFKVIKIFGKSGSGPGSFHGPEGIGVDNEGNIYVIDSGNHRIQKFNNNGEFIFSFGGYGEYEGQINNPSNLFIYKDIIYAADTGNNRIACFDDSGNFIENISVNGMEKPRSVGRYGDNLLISDENKGLIFFNLNDKSVKFFTSWDNNGSFSKLVSAEADRDNNLYCLDYNYESVFVFSSLDNVYTNFDIEITSVDIHKYPIIAFYLNVRNRFGKPVYNLGNKNFQIIEDSANIDGIYADYLKNVDSSVSAVLCIDRSFPSGAYHNEFSWISDFFLKKMKRNDSIKVLNFNKDTWVGNDFDWSRRRAIKALRKRSYDDGKCFGKAIYNSVSDMLNKINKRGVIIITDGTIDENSFNKYTPDILIEYARTHFVPIYFIVFKEKHPILSKIAEETGGKLFKASELDGLRKIYDNIKKSEENRYIVVYSSYRPVNVKGWWSDVKIMVNYKEQRGVEWGGYFVP